MSTIFGTNTKGLGFLLATDEAREDLEAKEERVDAAIATAEPLIIRSQFKRAVERLEELLEARMAEEGPQGGRALLEKMALIAGDRRTKAIQVEVDRRRS